MRFVAALLALLCAGIAQANPLLNVERGLIHKAAFASFCCTSSVAQTSSWSNLPLGGGGYVTQLVMHPSGVMIGGIDVFGFYVGSTVVGTMWQQQATSTQVPSAYQGTPYLYGGLRGAAIDPSNSQIMIAMYAPALGSNSNLWYSANGGTTWVQSGNFPYTSDVANTSDGGREAGQRMAIDPANDNIAYVGTMNGVYTTTNLKLGASATWTLVSTGSIPAPSNDWGIAGVQFDPNSGTTGGATNRILIGSNGNGVYYTTNAGSTWSGPIASVGTGIEHGIMASDQNYYVTTTGGSIYRINSSNAVATNWTTSNTFQCLAINPANPAQGVGFIPQGNVATQSAAINGASAPTSSTNFNTANYTTPDAPWIAVSQAFNSASDCAWDPLVTTSATSLTIGTGSQTLTVGTAQNIAVNNVLRISNTGTLTNYMVGKVTAYNSGTGSVTVTVGSVSSAGYLGGTTGGSGTFSAWTVTKERIWLSFGVGVAYMDTFPSSAPTWFSQTAGMETLVAGGGAWPTSGNPILTSDDRALWPVPANPLASTNGLPGYGPNYSVTLREGNFVAFDPVTPATWVTASNNDKAYLSTTGGSVGTTANSNVTSWASYTNTPTAKGPVATSNGSTVIAPMGTGTVQCNTTGAAGTWSNVTGGPASVVSSSTFQFWASINPLVADYVTAGKFYLFANNNIYTSTNCSSWSSVYSSFTTNNYLIQLKAVPANAGHLFFTAGGSNGTTTTSLSTIISSHPNSQLFYFSSNGGAAWNSLSNVKEVLTFAVGATKPGSSYPTIYIIGWVNVAGTYTYGIYQCTNFNPASLGSETWTNIGTYLRGWIDLPQMMIADPNTYGFVIAGGQGSSFAFYGYPGTWP